MHCSFAALLRWRHPVIICSTTEHAAAPVIIFVIDTTAGGRKMRAPVRHWKSAIRHLRGLIQDHQMSLNLSQWAFKYLI